MFFQIFNKSLIVSANIYFRQLNQVFLFLIEKGLLDIGNLRGFLEHSYLALGPNFHGENWLSHNRIDSFVFYVSKELRYYWFIDWDVV